MFSVQSKIKILQIIDNQGFQKYTYNRSAKQRESA